MHFSEKEISQFQQTILSWYEKNKRDLPWRRTRDPYKILVSEVMSQQTQISRVTPKYEAWIKILPTVHSLANAKTSEVLSLWSGLGYNRRALYLQKAAKQIVDNYNGVFPQDIHILKSLPGIGKYTASAILCFAFNAELPVIDTNVRKVILTQLLRQKSASEKEIIQIARKLVPEKKAAMWNQALMDYAAIVLKNEKITITKQSTFKTSRRYYRGQILKMLVKAKKLRQEELTELFRASPYEQEEILSGLIRDGLVVKKDTVLVLP